MMPLKACPANLAPKVAKVGAGPAKNMEVPSAILLTRVGFRRYRAPPRCVLLVKRRRRRRGAFLFLVHRRRPRMLSPNESVTSASSPFIQNTTDRLWGGATVSHAACNAP